MKPKKVKTSKFDAAEYLDSEETMAAYLNDALDDGDPRLVAMALGDIAKAKSMSKIAEASGLTRASLYKSLSADGNPEFSTIVKVAEALGLKLNAVPVSR